MFDFAATVKALSAISDVVTSLSDANNKVKINQVTIDLQRAILDVQAKMLMGQAEYQEVLDANKDLKQQLVAYEKWEQERTRYSLKEPVRGVFVYALNPTDAGGEQKHWLCATCYNNRKKTILQHPNRGHILCPTCQTTLECAFSP